MSSEHLYEVMFSFVFSEMRTLRYRQDKGPGQVTQVSGGSLIGSERAERGEVAWGAQGQASWSLSQEGHTADPGSTAQGVLALLRTGHLMLLAYIQSARFSLLASVKPMSYSQTQGCVISFPHVSRVSPALRSLL